MLMILYDLIGGGLKFSKFKIILNHQQLGSLFSLNAKYFFSFSLLGMRPSVSIMVVHLCIQTFS
jgi:hypothetical protein